MWILADFGISTELLIFRRHAITVVFYKGEWKEWQWGLKRILI